MSSTPAEKTRIIIISKSGSLSECIVETNKETTLDELTNILSTKCGNKKSDGFSCYHTYKYKNKKKKNKNTASAPVIYIDVWCKTDGRAGQENKYELPPPIDEIIFFGNMALVARIDKQTACDISIELWSKIYEKLFGGFEDLAATAQEDENEIDELAFVPASKKTANGYLKDGFVVDDSIGSSGSGSTGNSSTGNSDDDLVIQKKKAGGGGGKKKSKTKKSDSTTESEFVTETETETESISDSEIRSDSSNDTPTATSSVTATPTQTITVTATATATVTPAVTVKANKKTTTTTTTTNRKIAPSVKKTPVAKKATKKDEMKTAAVSAAAAAASAASSVSAILGNSSDSELSEDSYST
jgi:hypothetical protein